MSTQDPSRLAWFKSSYSGNEGGECLEVAMTECAVHVRDSKTAAGPHLSFPVAGWSAFLEFTGGR